MGRSPACSIAAKTAGQSDLMGRASATARLYPCASVCICGGIFLLALPRAAPVWEGPPSRGARQNLVHQISAPQAAPHRRQMAHAHRSPSRARPRSVAVSIPAPPDRVVCGETPMRLTPWTSSQQPSIVPCTAKRDGRETGPPHRTCARQPCRLCGETRQWRDKSAGVSGQCDIVSCTTKRDIRETLPLPFAATGAQVRK
jgi:hypothetical protein